MNFNPMIPELTVSDIDRTKDFYLLRLGFTLEYERVEDSFIFLSCEGSQFMFEQLHSDGWNIGVLEFPFGRGVNFSIACRDIDKLYARVLKHQIQPYRELHQVTYLCDGQELLQKQFLIQDPDGYLLRFTD